ncbi:hypothetical protein CRE_03574 [Caenorhabditis remanei]|uniref:HAT C-terminal dimerisation domain-containing protein n=1 Tax=Caenorhabditis remanei TaxID=31234 RepID=E3NTD8_CAERE|nr:hypothetical protein CRE_03574 [Caenorhabditis remanei]
MENGYSWYIAVVFTFGETAGSGLVALPNAMLSLGKLTEIGLVGGMITLIVMCLIPFYTATLLGNNWIIMKTRWSEYSEHCRNPYPEMAQKALGDGMGHFTSFCTYLTVFGGTAVFSLLAAKTLSEVLNGFGVPATMCSTLIAVGIILWPCVMLKSPMHFWQVSIVATVSTVTAVALILFGYALDVNGCHEHSAFPEFTPVAASNSLATIIFAYGGHPCIPTIVHDMKTPQHYFRCFLLSYIDISLFDAYMKERVTESTPECPLKYWFSKKDDFPLMSKIAFNVFSTLSSETVCERAFSAVRRVVRDDRQRLNPELIENIMIGFFFEQLQIGSEDVSVLMYL